MGMEQELPLIGKKECYYSVLPAQIRPKRDRIIKLLSEVGMIATVPDGTYFVVADFSNLGTSCLTCSLSYHFLPFSNIILTILTKHNLAGRKPSTCML